MRKPSIDRRGRVFAGLEFVVSDCDVERMTGRIPGCRNVRHRWIVDRGPWLRHFIHHILLRVVGCCGIRAIETTTMSLEALNQPPLIAAMGAAAFAALPLLERALADGTISFVTIKALNGLLYGLNVYAVSQPGRLDGPRQDNMTKGKKLDETEEVRKMRERSLVMPQDWAFTIWAPIFIGELVFCSTSVFLDESSPAASVIRKASGGFMIAQVFQTLWSASFRPKYKGRWVHVSGAMLTGIAYSMSRAHAAFTGDRSYTGKQYALFFLPMTLHFGWTTAASLVNWNGNVAMTASPKIIAAVGHASAVSAAALGAVVTLTRKAPVFGGAIAWALTACAFFLKDQIQKKDDKKLPVGMRAQMWLCGLGAIVAAAASVVALAAPRQK